MQTWLSTSVTRNGDLLPFWAILKAKNFYSKNKNVKFKKMRPKVIEPSAIFEPKTFWSHCPRFQGESKVSAYLDGGLDPFLDPAAPGAPDALLLKWICWSS